MKDSTTVKLAFRMGEGWIARLIFGWVRDGSHGVGEEDLARISRRGRGAEGVWSH